MYFVTGCFTCAFYFLKVFELLAIRRYITDRAIPKLTYKMSAWPARFLILLVVLYDLLLRTGIWFLFHLWLQNIKTWKYIISFVSILVLISCRYTDFLTILNLQVIAYWRKGLGLIYLNYIKLIQFYCN